MTDADLAAVFPALDRIEEESLRDGVRDAWAYALGETDWDDLAAVPWLPDEQERLDIPDETLVAHVNDVATLAAALADALARRRGEDDGVDCSRDLVLAGALVHDVSKLYEFDADGATLYYDLLGHPYVGVHVCEAAGLPAELAHVILSHTYRTSVEPATLEAELVRRADEVAGAAIRSRALEDLRDA